MIWDTMILIWCHLDASRKMSTEWVLLKFLVKTGYLHFLYPYEQSMMSDDGNFAYCAVITQVVWILKGITEIPRNCEACWCWKRPSQFTQRPQQTLQPRVVGSNSIERSTVDSFTQDLALKPHIWWNIAILTSFLRLAALEVVKTMLQPVIKILLK